jgi:hypothetical protein
MYGLACFLSCISVKSERYNEILKQIKSLHKNVRFMLSNGFNYLWLHQKSYISSKEKIHFDIGNEPGS